MVLQVYVARKKKGKKSTAGRSASCVIESWLFLNPTFWFASQEAVRNLCGICINLPLRPGWLTQMLALYPLPAFEHFF
jgi:hypothetical protein